MKTVPNILFVQRQAVGRMALEVIPDLLGRVEFRGVLGEELGLHAGIVEQHSPDRRPLVDLALVPQQDDGTGHVAKELTQERGHVQGLEVVLLKTRGQADTLTDRTDREHGQGRDAVMLVAVGNLGRLALRPPRPAARGNEQKAAFIKEGQMGPKFSRLFLWFSSKKVVDLSP